jgi:hypothetical protein
MSDEALPIVPHAAGEFYLWLWWMSESHRNGLEVNEQVGRIDLWVDQRLAFRNPEETRVSAVLTGDNPSETLEAKAAVYGGKVLQEVRLHIGRDEREFLVTLKGPEMHMAGLKLPQALKESPEEAVYDRLFLYDEIVFVIGGLFQRFASLRSSPAWSGTVVPAIMAWVEGANADLLVEE